MEKKRKEMEEKLKQQKVEYEKHMIELIKKQKKKAKQEKTNIDWRTQKNSEGKQLGITTTQMIKLFKQRQKKQERRLARHEMKMNGGPFRGHSQQYRKNQIRQVSQSNEQQDRGSVMVQYNNPTTEY